MELDLIKLTSTGRRKFEMVKIYGNAEKLKTNKIQTITGDKCLKFLLFPVRIPAPFQVRSTKTCKQYKSNQKASGRRLWTFPFTELMSDSARCTFWRCYIQKVLPLYKDHFWFILFLTMLVLAKTNNIRKQPSKCALRKNFSENMQQICRRTPIPKCGFNKVTLQPY